MALKLSRQQRQQLLDWASEAGERECCGLLFGQDGCVDDIQLTPNVADNPELRFEIAPSALIHAEKSARRGGPQILGYFHSHPNGRIEPSETDAQMAAADGRRWIIIARGSLLCWLPVAASTGRPISFAAEDVVEA